MLRIHGSTPIMNHEMTSKSNSPDGKDQWDAKNEDVAMGCEEQKQWNETQCLYFCSQDGADFTQKCVDIIDWKYGNHGPLANALLRCERHPISKISQHLRKSKTTHQTTQTKTHHNLHKSQRTSSNTWPSENAKQAHNAHGKPKAKWHAQPQ